MPTLFKDLLAPAARECPDSTLFVSVDRDRVALSYAEVVTQAELLAQRLRAAGLEEGDLLAVMAPNSLEYLISLFAASSLGVGFVPVPPFFRPPEISKLIRDCQPDLFLLTPHLLPQDALESVKRIGNLTMALGVLDSELKVTPVLPRSPMAGGDPPPRPDDLAMLIYTSGTTGLPKGVILTNANLLANAEQGRAAFDVFGMSRSEMVFSGVLPVCHSFGVLAAVSIPVATRGSSVIAGSFNPKALFAALRQERVAFLLLVPEMYRAMNLLGSMQRKSGGDGGRLLPDLRAAISGGAPLPQVTADRFEAIYDQAIHQGYGLTETSPLLCVGTLTEPSIPGSVGPPVKGVEVAVVDDTGQPLPPGSDGTLLCSGPNISAGYLNQAELTGERFFGRSIAGGPEKRWFSTGDRATIDDNGRVYVSGRQDDLILVNGLNVYPAEIVNALMDFEDCVDVVVGRIRSGQHGQEPVALLVPKPGANPTEEAVRAHLMERVAIHKLPAHIVFVDAIEKTALGKPKPKDMLLKLGYPAF
ncbi:MAG TPA: AMP-binding protein [Armatimonadota bacterium]|jgi:long-chain acyl-CoA synthetase